MLLTNSWRYSAIAQEQTTAVVISSGFDSAVCLIFIFILNMKLSMISTSKTSLSAFTLASFRPARLNSGPDCDSFWPAWVQRRRASSSPRLICTSSEVVVMCVFGVSSTSTHYFPATAALHFQTVLFAESDVWKGRRMLRPVPGTTHVVVVSPLCRLDMALR